ncbi:MAG: fibronectin type III domain-containing protein [Opitutaceae bacterium]|jgi:hypothetical protein|nr:fibronectin type III domain-containing protein [Opitutaceae bacterium]
MKNKTTKRLRFLACAGAVSLLATLSSQAAVITWGTAQNITGDSDVSTTGSLVYAINFGGRADATNPVAGGSAWGAVSPTINGVTFLGGDTEDDLRVQSGMFSTSGATDWTRSDRKGNVAPYTSLSAHYQILLQSSIQQSADEATVTDSTFTLTLEGLTEGNTYQVQIWANDSNSAWRGQNSVTLAAGGNSVSLDYNVSDTVGGLGQYVLGSFTATATTQEITFTSALSDRRAIVNALQLRDLSNIPEPGTCAIVITSLAGIAAVCLRRRRERTGRTSANPA